MSRTEELKRRIEEAGNKGGLDIKTLELIARLKEREELKQEILDEGKQVLGYIAYEKLKRIIYRR